MALGIAEVEKIAALARLDVPLEALPRYATELSNILALVERMNAVETAGVEPMAHPLRMTQRLRPDEVAETDRRETFQRLAPLTEDGLYLVPRVIE